MTTNRAVTHNVTPDTIFEITELEHLRVLSDPLRMRPNEIRGRAISAIQTVNSTTNVISMALAGIIGAVIGARLAFIAGGVFAIIGGALAWVIMRDKSTVSVTQSIKVNDIGVPTRYSPDE